MEVMKIMEVRTYTRKKPVFLIIISIFMIMASVTTIISVIKLQNVIGNTTKLYINDIAYQMGREIDSRLQDVTENLQLLEDTLKEHESVQEHIQYLNGKLDLLGFSAFGIANLEGDILFTDGKAQSIKHLDAFTQAINGMPGVSFLEEQSILYTVPNKNGDKIIGVLAGIINKEKMQLLLESHAFGGKGVSCIIDSDYHVVISPRDMNFFMALDDVFQEKKDPVLVREIEQLMENIKKRQDGNLSFTTVNGDNVLMSYNALTVYNWTLLTIIPADFISAEIDSYMLIAFAIAFLIILIFVIILIFMMINWRKHNRDVERIAYTDPVTGDINLNRFYQMSRKLINNMPPRSYYMVSLNVKSFKLINERFGFEEGNNTIRYIFRTIKNNIFEDELAVHAEADKFLLCVRAEKPEALRKRLAQLVTEINHFNNDIQIPYYLTILRGAYLINDPSMDIKVIIERANIACRYQPEEDSACFYYNEALIQKLQMEQDLLNLMEPSLENGDFKIYLQPKVRLCDGKMGGAEALIRWQHPGRGVIYPSDFIPLFEKNGSICRLDLFVFEQVCKFIKHRLESGEAVFPISVNLSRQHFKITNFLSQFEAIKNQYHIPDGLIELELTESVIFDSTEFSFVKNVIHQMHKIGFQCSLDDFGFGYSSLSLLSVIDVDTIKLDRSFFKDKTAKRSEWVVETIVNLSKKLNIQTVAEGIEFDSQLDFLRGIKCDMVQGYIYSKPLPVDEFEQWVKENTVSD